MKLLAVKWRRLGDTVLWTSALEALKQLFPSARIDIAFPESLKALFANDPRFEKRWLLPSEGSRSEIRPKEIRKESYDTILVFHASRRSAALALFAGARQKVIHHHDRRGKNYFSDLPVKNLGVPARATERDLNVIRTLGWNGTSPATRIFVSDSIKEAGRARLRNAGRDESKPIVVLGPSASRAAKLWPLSRFANLARSLKDVANVVVVTEKRSEIESRGASVFEWRGAPIIETSGLEDLMGVLAHADCYVGSDSGVKHLACALGVRTVTLFGPESLGEWHCYSNPPHIALQKPVFCRSNDIADPRFAWCGVEICPHSSHSCMSLITVDEVEASVRSLLPKA